MTRTDHAARARSRMEKTLSRYKTGVAAVTTIIHTEAELHNLLDGLTEGQVITARWDDGDHTITSTGPVQVDCAHVSCYTNLRRYDRKIDPDIISVEVTTGEAVTVTREDPDALLELANSLTEGQMVTAEWREDERSMILTGPVGRDISRNVRVLAPWWRFTHFGITANGALHPSIHSVTITRPTTVRWERKAS